MRVKDYQSVSLAEESKETPTNERAPALRIIVPGSTKNCQNGNQTPNHLYEYSENSAVDPAGPDATVIEESKAPSNQE